MTRDPYKYFRIEARELLTELSQRALELEKPPKAGQAVARMLRAAHTLKGAARVVKQRAIADDAHALEDLLAPQRGSNEALEPATVETALGLIDAMQAKLAALDEPKAEAVASPGQRDEPTRTVRAELSEMDELLELVAETQVELGSARSELDAFEELRTTLDTLRELTGSTQVAGRERVRALAEELTAASGRIARNLRSRIDNAERELLQVRQSAERLRLVPAATLFVGLERTLRDAAQALSKRVLLETQGGDVRLDADVLSTISEALTHIVRNAVVHGIEPESERRATGKPPEGKVSLEIRRSGRRVAFVCRDDGRGIDEQAVRRAAEREGRAGSSLADVLLQGGVTTADRVTELSGRGVGLEVVREAKQRLGGELIVETIAGRGTTFQLVIPVSASSIELLTLVSDDASVAIPRESVSRTLRLASRDVARSPGGDTIAEGGEGIPFIQLSRLLASSSTPAPFFTAVIVHAAAGQVALGVDRLGTLEYGLLRPLPELAPADPIIGGAIVDAQGNPRLVLDPEQLVERVSKLGGATDEPARARLPVLVIDDSLTTRMLERSILEAAGYDVELATSAEEGLEKARARRYALFLVDVEMPGKNGFEFVAETRADPRLSSIPAILVTSRASEADRRRGREAGAAAYIVKSEFDQAELLERIRELTR